MSLTIRQKKAFSPKEAMGLALIEGYKGAGFVSPNPLVGCVILDEGRLLLNSGYHKKYGGPHAEIEALKGISEEQLEGAHVYVTLEPCAHEGQTPSCAKRLAELPIASVTYGIVDPNPLTSGKGIEILKKAGKIVQQAEDYREELETLSEVFFHNMKTKRPFVALKVASSLDGQMGLKSGDSKWITNERSRTYAHYLRGVYDAILVGRRTVNVDNPNLNIRHPDFPNKANRVIIMDPYAEIIEKVGGLNIGINHRPEDIFFVVSDKVAKGLNVKTPYHVVSAAFTETDGFDLDTLMDELYRLGICSILLEGGSFLYQTFLSAKKVQRIYAFLAPIVIGAKHGLSWTSGFGINSLSEKIVLAHIQTHFFDNDVLVTGRINLE